MPYTPYFFGVLIASLFGWASWLVVIFNLSPFTSPQIALTLFYSSFFVALGGSFSTLIYVLRSWRLRGDHSRDINISLREGILIALMISIGAVFQRLRVLTWWDAALLFAIILLAEFYFMSRD